MAGQTVVSRNHRAVADNGSNAAASPAKQSSSSSSLSPKKNPFKRKRRRLPVSKCLVVGVCCLCGWFFLFVDNNNKNTGGHNHLDVSQEVQKKNPNDNDSTNTRGQQQQRGHLSLRPPYLTDDGKEDVGDDGDDGEETDEAEEETDPVEEEGGEDNEEEEEWEDGQGDEGQELEVEEREAGEEEEIGDLDIQEEGLEQQKVRLRSPSHRDPERRKHKIPRILIFTHYKNLLQVFPLSNQQLLLGTYHNAAAATAPDIVVANNAHQPNPTPEELEEWALAVNVRHAIDIHNQTLARSDNGEEEALQVLFWTDDDCIQSLERTRPKLVSYFKKETEGMYKADICRGSALLEHGGIYLDVDIGVRHNLWKDLRPQTEFVTARVHLASNWVGKGFFQAVLGASPQNPVLDRYLELFEQHYNGTSRIKEGPLGVLLLKRAFDQVFEEQHGVAAELYQEVQFQKKGPFDTGVLQPAPTWGTRRACHFVVVGMANNPSNTEIVLQSSTTKSNIGLKIPVLSRIPGSRMCAPPDPGESRNLTRVIQSMRWWEQT
jgi:hypothetical protein